jgi:UDP-glucose 4-epimerase
MLPALAADGCVAEASAMRRKNLRVLVTGGAGFIGSHLVDALVKQDCRVWVLDNLSTGRLTNLAEHLHESGLRFVKGDVRSASITDRIVARVDAIIHESAVTDHETCLGSPTLANDVNVGGTLNLLEAARRHDVGRFVYASSAAVYGEQKHVPMSEEAAPHPISPYGASKLAAEQYCLAFHSSYGLSTTCLRYFNVFGPRQSARQYSGVISQFAKRLLLRRPPVIFGTGKQIRDFVSVEDIVEATLLALDSETSEGELYNVGTGRATTINGLAAQMIKVSGTKKLKARHTKARPGDIQRSVADIGKACRRLGYLPRTRMETDVSNVYDWYARRVPR